MYRPVFEQYSRAESCQEAPRVLIQCPAELARQLGVNGLEPRLDTIADGGCGYYWDGRKAVQGFVLRSMIAGKRGGAEVVMEWRARHTIEDRGGARARWGT